MHYQGQSIVTNANQYRTGQAHTPFRKRGLGEFHLTSLSEKAGWGQTIQPPLSEKGGWGDFPVPRRTAEVPEDIVRLKRGEFPRLLK